MGIGVLLLVSDHVHPQIPSNRTPYAPKREVRGVWISTINNIDWPLSRTDPPSKQQADFIVLLDSLTRLGINTIFFQIRPAADAFYASRFEPWSQWLTGEQGKAPEPFYDPLVFAIDACHRHNIELHAWINPYRVIANTATTTPSAQHISVKRPDLVRYSRNNGTSMKMLDPGEPETIPYILKIVVDVLRRYDIDGLHMDDYFYPYPAAGFRFDDEATYRAYGKGVPKIEWRRQNVNRLIYAFHDSIAVIKPYIKFGVSPFGIWRNIQNDYRGSATNGGQGYDELAADALKWLREGIVDYIAPQIYWNFVHERARYDLLVDWWNNNSNNRHIYIGQAAYKMISEGWSSRELIDQIVYNRKYQHIKGNVIFSARQLFQNVKAINDNLRMTVFSGQPLCPTMEWKDRVPPNPPVSLVYRMEERGIQLSWTMPSPAADGDLPMSYVIYGSSSPRIDFQNLNSIVHRTRECSVVISDSILTNEINYFAITSLDRLQNESVPGNVVRIQRSENKQESRITSSSPDTIRLNRNIPNPFSSETFISFYLPERTKVTMTVYDSHDHVIVRLLDEMLDAGEHQLPFFAGGLPSGIYYCRLTANGRTYSQQMELSR
jgi:uncharacterized lipoprotein YddW (UPF0748 family)